MVADRFSERCPYEKPASEEAILPSISAKHELQTRDIATTVEEKEGDLPFALIEIKRVKT